MKKPLYKIHILENPSKCVLYREIFLLRPFSDSISFIRSTVKRSSKKRLQNKTSNNFAILLN